MISPFVRSEALGATLRPSRTARRKPSNSVDLLLSQWRPRRLARVFDSALRELSAM